MVRINNSHGLWYRSLLFCMFLLIFFIDHMVHEPTSAQNPEPEVRVRYPNGGETVNGTVLVQWELLNPPAETPRFTVSYWYWEEPEWVPIVSGITGTSYPWDTRDVPNGQFVIQVTLTSVSPAISDESDNFFTVDNGDLPRVRVYYPNGGETVGGTVLLTWSVMNPGSYNVSYEVYYWNGAEWLLLIGDYPSVSYSWDTTQVPDGAYYRIKVIVYSEVGVSEDTSDGTFTILNGERIAHAPTVRVTYPNGGETLTGQVQVTWTAADPDGDPLTYSLRCWDGSQWHILAQNVAPTNWTWATLQFPDGAGYLVEVMASDGTFFVADQSDTKFTIHHIPPVVDILAPRPAANEKVAVLTNTAWVNWTVTNPAQYPLTYGIELWLNAQWLPLARNLTTTAFPWDTREFPDGEAYKLRVLAYFGPRHSEGITDPAFHIANAEPTTRGRLPEVELEAPRGGETWKGIRTIAWVGADPDGNRLTYTLHFWNGTRWVPLVGNLRNTSWTWDVSRLPSRTDYRVRVMAFDGTDRGVAVSEEFAIGGNPPIVEVLFPQSGATIQGNVTLAWKGFDPDGRELTYTVEYRHLDNWTVLVTNTTEPTFRWDTRSVENGQEYQLRVTANNGVLTGVIMVEDPLTIENNFPPTVTVVWPNGGEELQGTVKIRWTATDRNNPPDTLTYTVSYLLNEEESVVIAEDVHATHLVWDTSGAPDLNWTVIRVQAQDPSNLTAVDDSDVGFVIRNRPATSPMASAEPPRWLVLMAQGVVIGGGVLFLFVVSMLLIGQQKKREQQALQATTERQKELDETRRKMEALETKREKVKARLRKVENQKKAVLASEPVRGWPDDLVLFQARLEEFQAHIEELERDPMVEKYLHTKQGVEDRKAPIHRYLSMLGEQVGKLLSYFDMETIEPQEGIGTTELGAFAEDPVGFVESQSFGMIEPLARRVRALVREAQLSWDEHKLSSEPFADDNIGEILTQTQALLKTESELIKQEKKSQVVDYLKQRKLLHQRRTALQQLREIEQKTIMYHKLLTKLNTQLKQLKKNLK